MSTAEVLNRFFPDEGQTSEIVKVLDTLESLHISCGVNCLEVTKSSEDFIGLCLFHWDEKKVLEDNNRRIRSGYIFTESSKELSKSASARNETMNRSLYRLIFDKIENNKNVIIVGFAQENRTLKSTSRTFNTETMTNLLTPDTRDGKALLSLRTLIFGSIIMYKINGKRNITPHSACLVMCLYLIVKHEGNKEDLEKFPIADIKLENKEIFLRSYLQMHNIEENILKVAFNDKMRGMGRFSFLTFGVDRKVERWTRVKWAMKRLMEGFQTDLTSEEFTSFRRNLSAKFSETGFSGAVLSCSLLLLFVGMKYWDKFI